MQAPTLPPVTESIRKRIVAVLFIAQGFFSASTIAAFTLTPIIAATLSGNDANAGIPNTLTLLGRAAFAYPLGLLMERVGRRWALTSGYAIAVAGSVLSLSAVIDSNYWLFLLGALLIGMARSASDQSRYVGAEVYPTERRARAIGVVVTAGTIGAIGGPLLVPIAASWANTRDWPAAAGAFAVAAVAMLLATLTIALFLRPDPRELALSVEAEEEANRTVEEQEEASEMRPMREIFTLPMVQLALLAMIIGFFVMVFLMVITPLHMNHHDHSAGAISNVIMAHTLGMFGLSWLTGRLVDRYGRVQMILAGSAVLLAACIAAPLSLQVPILGLALFLLGLGWNFTFVAGSSLLVNQLHAHERARVQGASEALVAITSGLASLTVGTVFARGDYLLVSSIGLALTLALIVATVVLVGQQRRRMRAASV